jgi:alpha-amylase
MTCLTWENLTRKGSVRTKYGTKDEYVAAVNACRELGMNIYADVVFNHKMGADHQEDLRGHPSSTPTIAFKPHRRTSAEIQILDWVHLSRQGGAPTPPWQWHWHDHFDAVDYNSLGTLTLRPSG